MAGIAGIAIGALNDLFSKELVISPLALSFLIGYSIEAFTSRLDAIIRKINKGEPELTVRGEHAD